MRQSEAAAFLPLIKAWSEGKELQMLTNGVWSATTTPSFIWPPEKYRVKPEPIVRYATAYTGRGYELGGTYKEEKLAIRSLRNTAGDGRVIRLVEDLDYVPPTS